MCSSVSEVVNGEGACHMDMSSGWVLMESMHVPVLLVAAVFEGVYRRVKAR